MITTTLNVSQTKRYAWLSFSIIGIIGLSLCSLEARTILSAAVLAAHPDLRRMTQEQAAHRLITFASAFDSPYVLEAAPEFRDVETAGSSSHPEHRHVWVVFCHTSIRRYALVLNDVTGNLIDVVESDPLQFENPSSPERVISPLSAANISRKALMRLRFVENGNKIALEYMPMHRKQARVWRVLWLVRKPGISKPSEVEVRLDSQNGELLAASNRYELTRIARE